VLGFRVKATDGTESTVEATSYEVDGSGTLLLRVADHEVHRVPAGAWLTVDPVGKPLTSDWPPDNLAALLDEFDQIVGLKYGNYERVGPVADYESPLLNEMEALVRAIADRIEQDPASTDSVTVKLFGEIRAAVLRHLT
jgi:hypothetical protein